MTDVWHDWGQLTQFLDHSRNLLPPNDAEDSELLMASVLIHSYALAEASAAERLGVAWRELGAIERWGAQLLKAQGKSWSKVKGGESGAVEVAAVRNVVAHGQRTFDSEGIRRLERVGLKPAEIAQPIRLDIEALRKYRGRLQSLMHHGAVGPT